MGVAHGVRRLPRAAHELVVGGEAAVGARPPREPFEDPLTCAPTERRRELAVAEDLLDAGAQLADVARLREEPGDAVLDHLREPSDPAADDGRTARHRLDHAEAEELRHLDVAPVARAVHGRQDEELRLPVERRKVAVRHRPEELDVAARSEAAEEHRVLALRRARVVALRSDDPELRSFGERRDEAIQPLVRRQAPDEEDAAATDVAVRGVPVGVGSAVDDAGSPRRRSKLPRRIGGHREEAVEEPRQQPAPVAARKPVVGDGRSAAAEPRADRGHAARRAPQVVRVDDVRPRDGARESGRQGVGRVAADPRASPQDTDPKPARVAEGPRLAPERDQLALDVPRERARKLERVPLAASEDPGRPEKRGSDVDDEHLLLPLLTLGDPGRLTGGYLYHRRMAEASPTHAARIVFLSFADLPFPLPALRGGGLLRRAEELGARAILVDSIAAAFAAPALARRRPDVPLVGVLHQPPGGIDHGRARTAVQAPLDRFVWLRSELLIAASDHLAEQLVAARLPADRIRVVPPGRDVAAAAPGAPGDLRRGRGAAFLCVANWVERKGILELLEAFARLPPDAATLHCAGDEDADPRYSARVRARLAQPDVATRVVRHGRLSREDVAALYAGADAFVLPAVREPYGTVWGEAMASGLPVVGWRAGNLPHLADDAKEALLADPGDVAGLARALAALARNPDLRTRLGEAARRRAARRPTWEEAAALFFGGVRSVVF